MKIRVVTDCARAHGFSGIFFQRFSYLPAFRKPTNFRNDEAEKSVHPRSMGAFHATRGRKKREMCVGNSRRRSSKVKRESCQKASPRSVRWSTCKSILPRRISCCVWINVPFAVTVYFQTNVSIEASARDRKGDAYAPRNLLFSSRHPSPLRGNANTKIFSPEPGNTSHE